MVSTTNLPFATTLDELLGNRDGGAVRTDSASLSAQLAANGPLADRMNSLEAGQQSGAKLFETWPQLAASPGTEAGEAGEVIYTATGTHTDPVAGGTVPNAGRYRWSTSPAGWLRVGDNTVTAKADKATAVSGSGLVTGGGDLSASRTLTVTAATASDVEAGTATDKAVTPAAVRPALDALEEALADAFATIESPSVVPLIKADDQVVAWLDEENGFDAAGLSARIKDFSEPRQSPISAKAPISTDGRSLSRLRFRKTLLAKAVAGSKLKIGMGGDSWAELNTLPIVLRDLLDVPYDLTGLGFRSAPPGNRISSAETYTTTGWTTVDGSETSTFPYGAGPDGQNLYTASTTATIAWTMPQATDVYLYTRNFGGKWRYQVDGGAWTEVTDNSNGALKVTSITGLTDAQHVINIDTTGNTGTVSWCGAYSTRNVLGAEVLKFGNGGTTGFRTLGYTQYMRDTLAHMAPDVLLWFLGTNDYVYSSSPPDVYAQAIAQIAADARTAVPNIGIIFVAPPHSNGTVTTPLSEYRDALHATCISIGCEFYNAYDDWPLYAVSSTYGLWDDDRHLNANGARVLLDRLSKRFDII